MYFLRIYLSKGQVGLMTYMSTDQKHLSGASGFCDRASGFCSELPKRDYYYYCCCCYYYYYYCQILDLPLVLQILAGTFPMTAS